MKKITVVVDMQNDFLFGSLANDAAVDIIPAVLQEIDKSDVVVYTRDTHFDNYLETQEGRNLPIKHCIEGTWGWQIVDELDPLIPNCNHLLKQKIFYIFNKPTFGCVDIWNDDLFKNLVEDKDVEVTFCGTCTDICVVSNAMIVKSLYPEIVVNVKADACAGLTPDKHKAALNVMDSCQINII